MQRLQMNYVFLLGRGRSGTTWLGRILSRYSRCNYKFEPFNPPKDTPYNHWLRQIDHGDATVLSDEFRLICSRCFHNIDYPPFFRRSCLRQSPALLRLTWQCAEIFSWMQIAYEWYGRPTFSNGDSVLIKQVNFPNEILPQLTTVLAPTIIGLIRNPYASVSSAIKFYGERPMRTPESMSRVLQLIAMPGYESLRHFSDTLTKMSNSAFEALRWRIQTEPLVEFTQQYRNGKVVLYETAVRQPHEVTKDIFNFLNWQYDDSIDQLINSMAGGEKKLICSRRRQFSVYRDPTDSLNKWKKNLTKSQIGDIDQVCSESPLMKYWDLEQS